MNTTSNFSENSRVETGILIKGNFKKEKLSSFDINNITAGKTTFEKENAVVRNIFQAPASDKSITGNHTYTILEGDERRLGKDGVLKVYNINKQIDIPVRKLLGNWKKTHIGITLIIENGQWCVEGQPFEFRIPKEESTVLVALRSLLRFALA
jgi:hypothetical protein